MSLVGFGAPGPGEEWPPAAVVGGGLAVVGIILGISGLVGMATSSPAADPAEADEPEAMDTDEGNVDAGVDAGVSPVSPSG